MQFQRSFSARFCFRSRARRSYVRIATAFLLLLLPAHLGAETKTVAGLTLSYESITTVDGKNSRLAVDGRILLIPTNELDGALLQYSLKSPNVVRKLPIDALLTFAREAINQRNDGWTDLAIQGIALHPQFGEAQAAELAAQFQGSLVAIGAVKKIIDDRAIFSALQPRVQALFLLEAGMSDLDWVREHALSSALSRKADFRDAAKLALSDAIRTRRFARLPALASLLREVLGVEDAQFQETKLISDQLIQFQQGLSNDDISALEIVLVTLKSNQELEELIFPYIVEEIHRVVRERLDKDRVVPALRLLSLVDLSHRTTATHTLLKLMVDRVDRKDLTALTDVNVRRFLFSLAQFDTSLKKNAERRFEELYYQALENGDYALVDRALDDVLVLRPDPNDKNDALRINYARTLRNRGMYEQGDLQLSAVKLGIPLYTRLRILAEDTFGVSLTTMLLEFIAILLIVVILLNRMRRASQIFKEKKRAREEFEQSRVESEEVPRGSTVDGPVFRRIDKISPERNEYNRLLMILGVSPSARFKEIRSAYRKAVKTHHPDMQGAGLANDKFVDLNQTYQRIMQLREVMGLTEDD